MSYATYWEQADGSVVDRNGLIITADERAEINKSVYSLPIYQENIKDDIMQRLRNGDDIIIDGSTGSGKSTWVPIFAREALGKKVIQTVPRVLAAMTCAERISQILLAETWNPDYTLGYWEVWYRTGAGSSADGLANLSVHTDGLEMMRQLLSEIFPSVLIIDEVQNKSIATELILFIAKYKLDIQLIIMSATLDPKLYQNYMESRNKDIPVIQIPWRTFPIADHYSVAKWCLDKTIELAKSWKHTLHLVSGKSRIEEVITELSKDLWPGYEIIPLHAELSKEEQFSVIIPPQDDTITRVMVATNVAEESITIPYLNAVVDEWMHKVWRINAYWVPELRVEAVTMANTLQRKWRVGRTSPWEYFRFNDTPIEDLHDYPEAAIENSMLEREILLFAKSWKDISWIIGRAKSAKKEAFVHQVDQNLLHIWYERLTQIGALDDLWNITALWQDLLYISLEPSLGRMIIEWVLRWCSEEIIAITAILSVNSFLSKDGTWKELKNGTNKKSDFFMYLDLYDLVTKKEINQEVVQRLVYLWLDRDEITAFQEQKDKALYEMVNLDPIGIKNHKVTQIANKISTLQNSLISNGISISKDKSISGKQIHMRAKQEWREHLVENILTSISAGYPFYVFEYQTEFKTYIQYNTGGTKVPYDFKQASISSVAPWPKKLYVAEPFIIGPNESHADAAYDETFFDSAEKLEWDFRIISHLTEISESHLKNAIHSQDSYASIFPERKKSSNSSWYANIDEVKAKYDALAEELWNESFSHRKFLQYALPLLLMVENKQFVKFLKWKPMQVVNSLENRLRKFFIHQEGDYIHRVSNNIRDIENSFINDSHIHDEFREWEQKATNARKKNKGKKITRTDAEVIVQKKELFDAQMLINQEIWYIEGGNFDTQFSKVRVKLLSNYINDIIGDGKTYNILRDVFSEEVWSKSVADRQKDIQITKESWNKKTQVRALKTRLEQCQKSLLKVQQMLDFTSSGTQKNYDSIDFDFCYNTALDLEKTKALFSKSQRAKYHKGIKAIRLFKDDKSWASRFQNGLNVANSSFTSVINEIQAEVKIRESELHEMQSNINAEKEGTLKTRTELNFFLSSIYEDEYFNTIVRGKISQILTEILESSEIDEVIEKYITKVFKMEELKKLKRTETIHSFLSAKKKYDATLRRVQKIISQYHKTTPANTSGVIDATWAISAKRKELLDLKSTILSI